MTHSERGKKPPNSGRYNAVVRNIGNEWRSSGWLARAWIVYGVLILVAPIAVIVLSVTRNILAAVVVVGLMTINSFVVSPVVKARDKRRAKRRKHATSDALSVRPRSQRSDGRTEHLR